MRLAAFQHCVDGIDQDEVLGAPYVLAWDSRTVLNAAHTLTAQARDAAGNLRLSASITVKVANDVSRTAKSAPTAIILSPKGDTGVVASDVISFRGQGIDPDSGPLPDDAFSWTIEIVDDAKSVQVNSITGVKNGSFTIPAASTDFSGFGVNTRYRITLNVTNQQGQKATGFVDVYPKKA